jgi:hypothetical protein
MWAATMMRMMPPDVRAQGVATAAVTTLTMDRCGPARRNAAMRAPQAMMVAMHGWMMDLAWARGKTDDSVG